MTTAMHRLQISLPTSQVDYLGERARRDGVSIAEVVRRLVERESIADRSGRKTDSLWAIAGIAEERADILPGTPVSERVDLYLAAASAEPAARQAKPRSRRRRARR
jgi:hypothetical protein